MIIHRADRFGLAQLYQLRGRVGRSKTRAFAYFTTPPERIVTETAMKRLQVLSDLDTLGAGFQLASHDLDIRGAGNLLGDEQSGHIREVGYELYQSMLEDAIMDAKAAGQRITRKSDFSPQITVDAAIMIPEDYVPDLDLRMGLYRRLNEVEDKDGLESFAAEMIDRFGALPEPTANLVSADRSQARRAQSLHRQARRRAQGCAGHASSKTARPTSMACSPMSRGWSGVAKLRPDMKLVINREWATPEARLNGALQLARGLAKAAG